jgi:hypothetical protein
MERPGKSRGVSALRKDVKKLKGLIALLTVVLTTLTAPGISQAKHHGYPASWIRAARCIRYHESRNEWHIQDGAYQIIRSTWKTRKPRSFPYAAEVASPAQQTFVAWRNWIANGRSWGNNNQWPNTARVCGVY